MALALPPTVSKTFTEPVGGKLGWQSRSAFFDGLETAFGIAGTEPPHRCFDPRPGEFSRREVWRIGRQIQKLASRIGDDRLDVCAFVDLGIV